MFQNVSWLGFALGAAFFAALTAIFGKLGVNQINSNLATLIRTLIIVVMIAGIVTYQKQWQHVAHIGWFPALMLALSAFATGLSWLCYYRALQLGPASKVAPIDKLSVALVVLLSVVFLGESVSLKALLGVLLIVAGGVLIAA